MKRLMAASACAVMLLAGASTGVASAAQPTPSPASNTAVVCDKSRTTVLDGIKPFTEELDRAGVAATQGDLAGADRLVRQSGTVLMQVAEKLRKDAEPAQSAELRKALEDVAKELETLGTGLTGVGSLQNFNTKRLEVLANRVAEICQK